MLYVKEFSETLIRLLLFWKVLSMEEIITAYQMSECINSHPKAHTVLIFLMSKLRVLSVHNLDLTMSSY